MTVTGFLFGLGLLLTSQVNNIWQVYLFYGIVFGTGLGAVNIIPMSTTARWFVRRRGMMSGIVKMGTGAGQLVLPLIASMLIVSYGWRNSYLIIGAVAVVILIAIGQLMRRDPESMGLLPDGDDAASMEGQSRAETGFYLHGALRTWQFRTICFAFLAALYCLASVMVHIVPHATDIGISPPIAAGILATIGGVSILGRFSIGMTFDHIGGRRSILICFLLLISALLFLQWSREIWMFYLFAAVYGIAHGGIQTVMALIVAEYFGLRAHGVIFGIVAFLGSIGGSIGSVVAGYIFDVTASYSLAFWICIAVASIGLGLILSLRHLTQT